MPTIEEAVVIELETFNQSVKDDLRVKGMDTTNNASNSLRVEKRGYVYVSVGINYIEYLDRGRPPGKFPLMTAIEKWVDLKGLQVDPFVVARGIAENGSRIYRNRELGLKLEEKTAALQEGINKILPKFVGDQIKTAFNKALRGR